jgi:post-segregation antitoxin (ccd killing protein)
MCGELHMATNLALDPELLDKALQLSGERTKKAVVTLALKEFIARRWVEENRESITAFNEDIEKRGIWSENMRSW